MFLPARCLAAETPEYISVMQQFAGTHVSLDDIDVCGSQKCQTCLGIDSDDRRHSAEQSAWAFL